MTFQHILFPTDLSRQKSTLTREQAIREMHANHRHHYGGPDALRVLEEECPEPKHGEVRVKVLAAGVSLPYLMMREGLHPETARQDRARK